MSYDIVYGKCFVKLNEDSFIPIIVYGSSNCYEYTYSSRGNTQRRERGFSNWGQWNGGQSKEIVTRSDVENKLKIWDEDVRQTNLRYKEQGIGVNSDPTRIDGLFKYGSKTFTMKGFKLFIKHGIKTAKTIEEIREAGLSLKVRAYKYNQPIIVEDYPKTTIEFFEIYAKAKEFCKENEGYRIDIYFTNTVDYVLKKFKVGRKRTYVNKSELKEYFIIRNNNTGYYYSRGTKKGLYWTTSKGFSNVYKTQKDAEKSVTRIKNRFFSYRGDNILEILKVDNDKKEVSTIFDNI